MAGGAWLENEERRCIAHGSLLSSQENNGAKATVDAGMRFGLVLPLCKIGRVKVDPRRVGGDFSGFFFFCLLNLG